jgi:hypothetical protein
VSGYVLEHGVADACKEYGDTLQAELAGRIVNIDGVDLEGLKGPKRIKAKIDWVNALSEDDFWYLWEDVQLRQGGIDLDTMVQCRNPSCGDETRLTHDLMAFILPRRPKRSKG